MTAEALYMPGASAEDFVCGRLKSGWVLRQEVTDETDAPLDEAADLVSELTRLTSRRMRPFQKMSTQRDYRREVGLLGPWDLGSHMTPTTQWPPASKPGNNDK
ncbi:unnamed protein product [Polarella glacialis]|uniref:Uncharacterized protein n=1 Tax=Polarella glacialis TaxID=89957 RepID=A0A813JNM6_POLGL|nr:unnamed protein product [Polarella glacialis]|mmetsp:Transcript_19629/g.31365  ORF Transcript_19629/g.31365 Transcript_19629/m.31365 type:complete len:103 (-) Transcript_19629:122-430(-)